MVVVDVVVGSNRPAETAAEADAAAAVRRSLEEPGRTRRSQEEPGGASRGKGRSLEEQEAPGSQARGSHEEAGAS